MKLYTLLALALVLVLLPHSCRSQDGDEGLEEEFDDDMDQEATVQGEREDSKPTEEAFVPLGEDEPIYKEPKLTYAQYFDESFPSDEDFQKNWVISKVSSEGIPKYNGEWKLEGPEKEVIRNDLGLVLTSPAKHYGISRRLNKNFIFNVDRFIIQYDVKFQLGQECGGAYVKLVSDETSFSGEKLNNDSPYTIMFGPDKCGQDSKLHFIIRYKNPITGKYEEKHAAQPITNKNIDTYFNDKKTHMYSLVIHSDNTYVISVDRESVMEGSLLKDMDPPINPPKEIADKDDIKPEQWDEREKIPDPDAVKPEDWDESQPRTITDESKTIPSDWLVDQEPLIQDPEAVKPEDWDDEMDGEWEAKMIDNPKCVGLSGCGEWKIPKIANTLYKGPWKAPLITNDDYKGKWSPRMIENPDFYEDLNPYKSLSGIQAVAFELWSMSGKILFDDIIISDDEEQVELFTKMTWNIKREQEMKRSPYYGMSVYDAMKPYAWSILGITVGIIAIIVYLCLPKKSAKKSEDPKKTDAVQADDEEETETPASSSKEASPAKEKAEEVVEDKQDKSSPVLNKSDENVKSHNTIVNETGDNNQTRQRKVTREDLNEKVPDKSGSSTPEMTNKVKNKIARD